MTLAKHVEQQAVGSRRSAGTCSLCTAESPQSLQTWRRGDQWSAGSGCSIPVRQHQQLPAHSSLSGTHSWHRGCRRWLPAPTACWEGKPSWPRLSGCTEALQLQHTASFLAFVRRTMVWQGMHMLDMITGFSKVLYHDIVVAICHHLGPCTPPLQALHKPTLVRPPGAAQSVPGCRTGSHLPQQAEPPICSGIRPYSQPH